ncbi:MAG TPA: PHP domain-containing protein [Steroidobacteraceae bacterium]|nr:PHP domain-containing protein [Steroidobacteraceae bacterium]
MTSVDLHLHSNHSDGVLAPAELVDRVADAGVELMALTDHDTTSGLEEARGQCARRGIRMLNGTELSSTWRGQTIHVIGLGLDPSAQTLVDGIHRLQALRRLRLSAIAERLERKSIPARALLAQLEIEHPVVTRTHLARALVAQQHAKSMAEAFKRYLGRGGAGHVASNFPDVSEVVPWIRAAGGIAVLAHPMRYTLSAGARRLLVTAFRDSGGTAIEVVCGRALAHIAPLAALAARFGLAGSVGSDFHDPQIPWNPPGRLAKLPAGIEPVWQSLA